MATLLVRLRKRTLRTKITKILNVHYIDRCDKLAMIENMASKQQEKIKKNALEDFCQRVQSEDFFKRPLVFTSYNSDEFVPGRRTH
jgi:hypothetical protein